MPDTKKLDDESLDMDLGEHFEDQSDDSDDLLAALAAEEEDQNSAIELEGTELDAFESASIDELEFVEDERLESIIESILFASDRPVSLASIKAIFKGTNIKTEHIKRCIERISVEYAGARRGVTLEEVGSGYQLRTKLDNLKFLSRSLKAKPFRLSGPALEVLSIVAYKQPLVKAEVDSIRGVESGHLLRALMEKGLVNFEGRSELPGKPMQYGTSKKFLEIFGLRNLKELPSISQIEELIPQGITDEEEKKSSLGQVAENLAQQFGKASYSDGEEELNKIVGEIQGIDTSSEFFEQEKKRQKQKREAERAQGIREAILVGEAVSEKDRRWLIRYDEAMLAGLEFSEETQKEQSSAELQG